MAIVEVLYHAQTIVSVRQRKAFLPEDGGFHGRGRMDVDDVGHGVATMQCAEHRHHRRDPAAARPEEDLGRRGIREYELTLGQRQADDGAGLETAHQVFRQEPFGHCLDRDRQLPIPVASAAPTAPTAPVGVELTE